MVLKCAKVYDSSKQSHNALLWMMVQMVLKCIGKCFICKVAVLCKLLRVGSGLKIYWCLKPGLCRCCYVFCQVLAFEPGVMG